MGNSLMKSEVSLKKDFMTNQNSEEIRLRKGVKKTRLFFVKKLRCLSAASSQFLEKRMF